MFCLHLTMCSMCVSVRPLGTGAMDGWQPWCGCWDSNLDPLQQQQVLLTGELSPQPEHGHFCLGCLIDVYGFSHFLHILDSKTVGCTASEVFFHSIGCLMTWLTVSFAVQNEVPFVYCWPCFQRDHSPVSRDLTYDCALNYTSDF